MKFLIQHNLMNAALLETTRQAVAPFPVQYVGLIPFSRELTSDEPIEGVDYIPYGSTLLTTLGLDVYKWKGLHFDLAKFNYEEAAKNHPHMLNGQRIIPISEAIEHLELMREDQDVFIRPSEDLKQFSGQVMSAHECLEWLKDAVRCASSGSYKLEGDTMVVLDSPKNIQAEWRYFVVDGEVVSGSMYRYRGQLLKKRELDEDVIKEAQEMADVWLPDPCCVMDLALVDDEVRVVEFNCINASGPYDNDMGVVFKALWDYHAS